MAMYEVKNENDYQDDRSSGEKIKAIISGTFDKLQYLIIFLASLVVLYLVLITPHQVDGQSMDPTYKNDQYLIANKLIYKLSSPKRGDVVIFKRTDTQDYIKRIIGLPGDTVTLQDGTFFVNGEKLDESEYLDNVITDGRAYLGDGESITVPDEHYFVSGDNRNHSSDSRDFGPVKFEDIKGRVWFVVYPLNDFHIISRPQYGDAFKD